MILTTEAALRTAVAETISGLDPAVLLAYFLPKRKPARRPEICQNNELAQVCEAAKSRTALAAARATDRHTETDLEPDEAAAFAAWVGRPYANKLAVQTPRAYAASVAERPDRAREILEDGRPLLAFAPTRAELPFLAAAICRGGRQVARLVVTDRTTIARSDAAATTVERPSAAQWSYGIPAGLTAGQTLSPTQRWVSVLVLIAAGVLAFVYPLALPIALQLFVTVVLIALSAARGAASQAAFVAHFAPPRCPLEDAALPRYSILVPLYNEAAAVPGLLASLAQLDYPAEKLEAILLVEADDTTTQAAILAQRPPPWVRVVEAPPNGPRTKPKALNIGLGLASGDLITVFDAEDRPEPAQLRCAAETFAAGPDRLACLQARLAIDHAGDTFITRMFAVEYACLFDVLLPWLAAKRFFFPLGGTSNHFRREVLVAVGGWDAYNVTEDADLGVRLGRLDYEMSVIDATTFEEAPLGVRAWLKQRTRWLKGWMQTWLVHMRRFDRFARQRTLAKIAVFHALILGSLLAALAFPVCLALIAAQATGLLAFWPGDALAGWALFAANSVLFVAGFTATIALSLRAIRLRRLPLSPAALLWLPVYWLLMALALGLAVIDLCRRPHHWAKTRHGLARRPQQTGLGGMRSRRIAPRHVHVKAARDAPLTKPHMV
ncbi:glycosyltransferase [Amorphus sp. 3PC139-8]|uniref:glycosyltransferase n=1 Tax=Amorphus sp. 3PC139-8 TaxID=2735676 RepID=UPI00345D0741